MRMLQDCSQITLRNDPTWDALFATQVATHPGKMRDVVALEALVWMLSRHTRDFQPVICDPLFGVGSTALACHLLGLPVVGMEYDPNYVASARATMASLGMTGNVLCGDSFNGPPSHYKFYDVVFCSPPFPNAHTKGASLYQKKMDEQKGLDAGTDYGTTLEQKWGCSSNPNVSRWTRAMTDLLRPWVEPMSVGSYLLVHIKDHVRKGKLVDCGEAVGKAMASVGVVPTGYLRWEMRDRAGFSNWKRYYQRKVISWTGPKEAKLACGHLKNYARKDPDLWPKKSVCKACGLDPDYVDVDCERVVVGVIC